MCFSPWRFASGGRSSSPRAACCVLFLLLLSARPAAAIDDAGRTRFAAEVEPILIERCYDCHGGGASEAGVAFDGGESGEPPLDDPQLWARALRQLRAGLMPPDGERLPAEQFATLETWIKRDALAYDPANPDPGRVVLRRLNRIEYRNTVRDLLGVDFNSFDAFPPDDTGHGFDNLGEALSISPLMLEKYIEAAATVVAQALRVAGDATQRGHQDVDAGGSLRSTPATQTTPATPWQAIDLRAYFPNDAVPAEERSDRARRLLEHFASRAFRRPVDAGTLDRLVTLAESAWRDAGGSFDDGMVRAMTAVLASPRFLFRVEETEPPAPNEQAEMHPLVDEFALASRLSYFLWSTMPDAELLTVAAAHELRKELPAQLARMMKDERGREFYRNFVGQWLQTRDVESTPIDAAFVAIRDDPKFAEFDAKRNRFRRLRRRSERNRENLSPEERQELAGLLKEMTAFRERMQGVNFSGELRTSMREETERHVEYVLTENRPLTELIDCDYAFLNQRLAKHYGIEGIADLPDRGVKRVALPAGSARGGILTEGAVLAVTSNPDRTSPVKRGLFVLENVLGSPPPPPPPNVPPLDESAEGQDGKPLTMRESLERHRQDPLCHSCHARMDPIGLALENFNAMGSWREAERGSPIDSSGTLASGEEVRGIAELKKVLAETHAREFYACLVEKLLTYAVGRGLDYNDVGTVDAIIDGIVADGGRSGSLMTGVVNSAAFQRRRGDASGRLRESVSAAPAAR